MQAEKAAGAANAVSAEHTHAHAGDNYIMKVKLDHANQMIIDLKAERDAMRLELERIR
jgi:hypothetical protein